MGRVVVGVDGSPVGQEALAFAAEEARLRGAVLELVHVRPVARLPRDRPSHTSLAEYASAEAYERMVAREQEQLEEAEQHARRACEHLLDRIVEEAGLDGVKIETTTLVDRRPARRLVDLVHNRGDVELLVVGSRGMGEFTGMVLGSVSQACATHSRVPVTVVHQRRP